MSTDQMVSPQKITVRTANRTVSTVCQMPDTHPEQANSRQSSREAAAPAAKERIIPLGIQFL